MRKGPNQKLIIQCVNCGSENALIKKLLDGESVRYELKQIKADSGVTEATPGRRRLQPIASERYADKDKRQQSTGLRKHSSPSGLRTQ